MATWQNLLRHLSILTRQNQYRSNQKPQTKHFEPLEPRTLFSVPTLGFGLHQAEDLYLPSNKNWVVANRSGASDGQVIQMNSSEVWGEAKFTYSGASGSVTDLMVRYFDETNGDSYYAIKINGTTVSTWYSDRTSLSGGNAYQTREIRNLTINNGDEVKVLAKTYGSEKAALDFVWLRQSTADGNDSAIPAAGPYGTYEAANNQILGATDTATWAGWTGIHTRILGDGNSGSTRFEYDGAAGWYDMTVEYYDRSPETAWWSVMKNGNPVAAWGGGKDTNTWEANTFPIYLNQYAEVEIHGTASNNESARVNRFVLQPRSYNHSNTQPKANPDYFTVLKNSDFTNLNVAYNDTDANSNQNLIVDWHKAKSNQGATLFKTPKNIAYKPEPGFTGTDTFQYGIIDQAGGVDYTTVTVEVYEYPRDPEITNVYQDGVSKFIIDYTIHEETTDSAVLQKRLRTNDGLPWETIATIYSDGSYTDTDLIDDREYEYQIIANNTWGQTASEIYQTDDVTPYKDVITTSPGRKAFLRSLDEWNLLFQHQNELAGTPIQLNGTPFTAPGFPDDDGEYYVPYIEQRTLTSTSQGALSISGYTPYENAWGELEVTYQYIFRTTEYFDSPGGTVRKGNHNYIHHPSEYANPYNPRDYEVIPHYYEGSWFATVKYLTINDWDLDGDGLPNDWESEHPGFDPNSYNDPDLDLDGDGVTSLMEYFTGNDPWDSDTDDNGINDTINQLRPLDEFDIEYSDTDNDGIPDAIEDSAGLNSNFYDSDGDLLSDFWEFTYWNGVPGDPFDPNTPDDPLADADDDGLDNINENIHGSDPTDPDTDGDEIEDGEEAGQGSDPTDSTDEGKAPADDMIAWMDLEVGDPSGSHHERWRLDVGDISFNAPDYGKVGVGTYAFDKGESYRVHLHFVDRNIPNDEDYDETARILLGGSINNDGLGSNIIRVTDPHVNESPVTYFIVDPDNNAEHGILFGGYNGPEDESTYATLHFPIIDADVDSDNNNGFDLPDQSDEEDRQEQITTHGKWIPFNGGDEDEDEIPDFADLDGVQGKRFIPYVIKLSENIDEAKFTDLKLRFDYNASDPTADLEYNSEEDTYTITSGLFRIWRKDASEERTADDFIQSGTEYTAEDLGIAPGEEITLYIEAVTEFETTAQSIIASAIVQGGENWSGTLRDTVHIHSSNPVDIDIDSDNNNQNSNPDSSKVEEDAEEQVLGKIIYINNEDSDTDSIPDYADGMSAFPGTDIADYHDSSQGDQLTPIRIKINEHLDLDNTTITFNYDESDPKALSITSNGIDGITYNKPQGSFRIWTIDASEDRSTQSILDGGHFIPANISIPVNTLAGDGSTDEIILYIEVIAIPDTLDQTFIEVSTEDPTNSINAKDKIRITPADFQLIPTDENSTKQLLDTSPTISISNATASATPNIYGDGVTGALTITGSTSMWIPGDASNTNAQISLSINGGDELTLASLVASLSVLDQLGSGTFTLNVQNQKIKQGDNYFDLAITNPITGAVSKIRGYFTVDVTESTNNTSTAINLSNKQITADFSTVTFDGEVATGPLNINYSDGTTTYNSDFYQDPNDTSRFTDGSAWIVFTESPNLSTSLVETLEASLWIPTVLPGIIRIAIRETASNTQLFKQYFTKLSANNLTFSSSDNSIVSLDLEIQYNNTTTTHQLNLASGSTDTFTDNNGLTAQIELDEFNQLKVIINQASNSNIIGDSFVLEEDTSNSSSFESESLTQNVVPPGLYQATTDVLLDSSYDEPNLKNPSSEYLQLVTINDEDLYGALLSEETALSITIPTADQGTIDLSLSQQGDKLLATEDPNSNTPYNFYKTIDPHFNATYYENTEPLFKPVLGASPEDLTGKIAYLKGVAHGLGNGIVTTGEDLLALAKLAHKTNPFYYTYSLSARLATGEGLTIEKEVYQAITNVITQENIEYIANLIWDIAQENLDTTTEIITDLLLGDFGAAIETFKDNPTVKFTLEIVGDLFNYLIRELATATDYDLGRFTGAVVFEILSTVISFTKITKVAKLSKLNILQNIPTTGVFKPGTKIGNALQTSITNTQAVHASFGTTAKWATVLHHHNLNLPAGTKRLESLILLMMDKHTSKARKSFDAELPDAIKTLQKQDYLNATTHNDVYSVADLQTWFTTNPPPELAGRLAAQGQHIHHAVPKYVQDILGIPLDAQDHSPALILPIKEHARNNSYPNSFHSILNKIIKEGTQPSELNKLGGPSGIKNKLAKAYRNWGEKNGYTDQEIDSITNVINSWIDENG